MRTVIIGEYALRAVIVVDAIRAFAHVDLLNQLERRRVKHRHFALATIAGEAMLGRRGDAAMNTGRIGDRANNFAAVGIDNFDLIGMRDIEATRRAVDVDVIPSARASNRIAADNLVPGTALNQQTAEQDDGQHSLYS